MTEPKELILPLNFTPRSYQLAVFEALDSGRCDRAILRWARRAGKDKTCLNFMIKAMFQRVGIYYYLFPSYQQGRKAIWENVEDGDPLIAHFPKEWVKRKNDNQMKIELHNESIFRVVGTDDYDSIMGTNPVGLVLSEYAIQDPNAWQYLRPILAQNNGWAIFNGTPRGNNHMYELEEKNKNSSKWHISHIQTLWPDLEDYYPILDITKMEREKDEGVPIELLEQEYGALYTAGTQGAYYAEVIKKAYQTGRVGMFPPNDNKWTDVFCDLGRTDSTGMWLRQMEDKAMIWIDYFENNNQDLAFYIKELVNRGHKYRCIYLPHDANHVRQGKYNGVSTKQMVQELCQEAGMNCDVQVAEKPQDKQIAIQLVRSRFSCYFFNAVTTGEALAKLSLYHKQFDKVHRCFREVPVHDWTSDCADALSTEALSASINDPNDYFMVNRPTIISDWDPLE